MVTSSPGTYILLSPSNIGQPFILYMYSDTYVRRLGQKKGSLFSVRKYGIGISHSSVSEPRDRAYHMNCEPYLHREMPFQNSGRPFGMGDGLS